MVRFLLNNEPVELQVTDPTMTVLRFLREQQKKTGTKEGCASGDCGACTVVVASPNEAGDKLIYRTINSCIALMSSLHGKQLITVEDLADKQQLHPVQASMVEHHGSQCGFCTPGFVMSAFALYKDAAAPTRENVVNALSGNLCRCTGYRPIIDATLAACESRQDDKFSELEAKTLKALANLSQAFSVNATPSLLMPGTRKALRSAIQANPDAPLVAGSTDLGLEITQQHKAFETLISLSQMASLRQVTEDDNSFTIGAALPLSEAMTVITAHYPGLQELFTRFASLPVRNQATLGGNVANASPIGDTPPVLLAVNATIIADDGESVRDIAAKDFFLGYRQTALHSTEWISAIRFPKPTSQQRLTAYKVSKRNEDDISAVCAVFNVTIENDTVISIDSGFGGVAATPVTCAALASALTGKLWSDKQCIEAGKNVLASAFNPIDDVRASARYRNQVLANLWQRFWLEQQTSNRIETRVSYHA